MGDEEQDPSDSLIRRAKKKMDDSKLVEAAVRWGVIALLGTGAGYASHKVEDAQGEAAHYASEAKLLALEAELDGLREGLKQRVEVEMRERLEAQHKADLAVERRIGRIEGRLGIELNLEPAASAEVAPPSN